MKKRNAFALVLILCLMASFLTACGGGVELPLGHRYGNPEISFADGKVIINYICVDCDFYEIEERAVSTQVADGQAWDAAFQNLSMAKYSLSFCTTDGENTQTKHCIVTEDRGYYGELSSDGITPVEAFYTLQKNDGTFVTYILSGEEGTVSLAPETNGFYLENLKNQSGMYFSFEGKFDKFTYDPESGSYICSEPIEGRLNGTDANVSSVRTLQNVTVSIADGQILSIKAVYSEVNEYLDEVQVEVCVYNIGYSVVKVPQSVIEEVTGTADAADPDFTYEINNNAVTITDAQPDIQSITIPATVDGLPVVAIGENAFRDCTALTDIAIPESVKSVGDNAFLGCDSLINVKYAGTQTQWDSIAIGQTGNAPLMNATVHFKGQCVHSYDEGTIIEDPTCLDAGMKIYTCDGCGKQKTEYIPRLADHTYTNGTCTSCGADDPKYVEDTDEEPGGLWGAIVDLVEAILQIISFF